MNYPYRMCRSVNSQLKALNPRSQIATPIATEGNKTARIAIELLGTKDKLGLK